MAVTAEKERNFEGLNRVENYRKLILTGTMTHLIEVIIQIRTIIIKKRLKA